MKEKKPLPGPPIEKPYKLKQPKVTVKFAYRVGQIVWTNHKIFGWVSGKVESKWEFEGRANYRVVILDAAGAVRMLVSASEPHFFKEKVE